jgi:3-oxoacyl-(acyl-carrier-protein) synthase
MNRRVGVFGWGIVAPKSPNAARFRENLESEESWLSPFDGFGPSNFLVGQPEFNINDYGDWINSRFPPRHFQNLKAKMDTPSLYAIGAFIQALGQDSRLEALLSELASEAHVYVGTGLGAIDTIYRASLELQKAQELWDQFWAGREQDLDTYLAEAAEIDGLTIEGDVEPGKLAVIRERSKRHTVLQEKWKSPSPPWKISPDVIWNIHNTPASQISILAKITGLTFAPVAACSTFGVGLRLAMRAIQTGDAKVVVVGATDPPPHALTIGAFYSARVLAANRHVSKPLTSLQGTHISGGSVVWIVGDLEYMQERGFNPIGMEPVAVGVSADAHHIITPSVEGPKAAIRQALAEAHQLPDAISTWDLHATATPGDYSEMVTLRSMIPEQVLVTARKGTFGHGMSAGGGWELTAQYMGYESGKLFPTPLTRGELNAAIGDMHEGFVFDRSCPLPYGLAGKLSMGIGGVNACVLSRALEKTQPR